MLIVLFQNYRNLLRSWGVESHTEFNTFRICSNRSETFWKQLEKRKLDKRPVLEILPFEYQWPIHLNSAENFNNTSVILLGFTWIVWFVAGALIFLFSSLSNCAVNKSSKYKDDNENIWKWLEQVFFLFFIVFNLRGLSGIQHRNTWRTRCF